MTTRRVWLRAAPAAALGLLAPVARATEPPAGVRAALPEPRLQGTMRFRWLGLSIYDARLWRPGGAASPVLGDYSGRELALRVTYDRRTSRSGT